MDNQECIARTHAKGIVLKWWYIVVLGWLSLILLTYCMCCIENMDQGIHRIVLESITQALMGVVFLVVPALIVRNRQKMGGKKPSIILRIGWWVMFVVLCLHAAGSVLRITYVLYGGNS